jgi:hypothetical protein
MTIIIDQGMATLLKSEGLDLPAGMDAMQEKPIENNLIYKLLNLSRMRSLQA